MSQSKSVDGITNFDNVRDKFKFDTRHLRPILADKRATLPPPKKRRGEIIDSSLGGQSDSKKTISPSGEITVKPSEKPDLPKTRSQDEAIETKNKHFWQYKNTQRKILFAMASIVFVCGMAVTGYGIYVNRQVVAVNPPAQEGGTPARTVANSDEDPSEEPISDQAIWEYTVPADHPRLLTIPKLFLTARVINLGIDEYGNLQTPYSVWDTGWYRESAKPGSEYGATLIDGHVSGLWGRGVFSQLDTLNKGDEIIIELGSGEHIKYKVVTKEIFKKNHVDMNKAIKSVDLTKHGLNLITCNGQYISGERTFSHRLLVRAVVIE